MMHVSLQYKGLSKVLYPYRRHPLKTLQCPAAGTRPPPPAEVPLVPPVPRLMWQMCCSSCTHSYTEYTHKTNSKISLFFRVVLWREVIWFFSGWRWLNVLHHSRKNNTYTCRPTLHWAIILCWVIHWILLSPPSLWHLHFVFTSLKGSTAITVTVLCPQRRLWDVVLRNFAEKKTVLCRGRWLDYGSALSLTADRSPCPSHFRNRLSSDLRVFLREPCFWHQSNCVMIPC